MRTPDFQALAQPGVQRLRAYDPGLDLVALRRGFADGAPGSRPLIELGSNDINYAVPPNVFEAQLGQRRRPRRLPTPLPPPSARHRVA